MFDNIFALMGDNSAWFCSDDDGEPLYCGNFAGGKAVCIP